MATAAYMHDEMISESSNSKMKEGTYTVATKQASDNKDKDNKINYSYIEKHDDY